MPASPYAGWRPGCSQGLRRPPSATTACWDTDAVVARLAGAGRASGLHVVAHSLGGLLTLRLLRGRASRRRRRDRPHRLPGLSPLAGANGAAIAARDPGGAQLVGQPRPAAQAGIGRIGGIEAGMVAGCAARPGRVGRALLMARTTAPCPWPRPVQAWPTTWWCGPATAACCSPTRWCGGWRDSCAATG